MFTKSELLSQLESFAPAGTPTLVHSSLRAVGETEGRGEGLLEVLIEYFTRDGGLLCIPTHTWNCTDREITLDMTSDETCVGMLTRLAALHPLAHRSPHPTHSMAVFDGTPAGTPGSAEDFIACEVNRDCSPTGTLTGTSPDGCYGQLFSMRGKVMLLGVGHNRNTYIHAVEEYLGVPNRLTAEKKLLRVKLPSGEVVERYSNCHHAAGIGDVSANYPKYEPAFRRYGAIVDGKLGNADVQLCDARLMAMVVELVRSRSGGVEVCADASPLDVRWYQ